MGVQGPLAALALGRSPYDEVFDGQGEPDHREPPQQFDQRGRPINPETKRLNRDLIRAHNEVMLVIGVAEPENPNAGPEAERAIRHYVYEDAVGARLGNVAQQCVQAVGVFGIAGARQRILVYREYSQIPFWDMYERARKNFSFPSMVFAGAPASLLSNYLEAKVARLWFAEANRTAARKFNDGQHATPPEALAAASGVLAARADDLPSDEEDNEGLSATLISFDVEATDSAEAPAGLWSAELRPSAGPETKSLTPVHLDTGLTQLPVGLACDILTDSFVKLVVAPYEAVALRNMATIFLLRQGFSVASISRVRPFEGLTLTALVNFLSIELLSLSLSGEVWAIFTRLAQFFHRTEEEWKRDEDVIASRWWHNYLSS
ncbi:hypothetical protein NLU13_9730 [Sarocladium strictum]|uniref:Uncharacterized protein n=1 Tax=Sarocladium strictum TaxID=5046 RepID=A0AA39GBA3_SARSR|nr:hypothetical protein NLU13_9730 [Sarocladium strictum]